MNAGFGSGDGFALKRTAFDRFDFGWKVQQKTVGLGGIPQRRVLTPLPCVSCQIAQGIGLTGAGRFQRGGSDVGESQVVVGG